MLDFVKFAITNLQAQVADDVCITWQAKEFDAGTAGMHNAGVLNYAEHRAQ